LRADASLALHFQSAASDARTLSIVAVARVCKSHGSTTALVTAGADEEIAAAGSGW
jgi:hypothetical protein